MVLNVGGCLWEFIYSQRSERTSGASSTLHLGQVPSDQSGMRGQSGRWPGAFGLPTNISMGQPPVSMELLFIRVPCLLPFS